MDLWGALILVGFFLVFGLLVFAAYYSSRKDKEEKRRVWQQLGFTAIEADALLAEKISSLYQREGISNRYELRNLSRKAILDGEMFLFDLVETSGEDDSWTERQAVAIVSSYLNLPQFVLFPKVDEKYILSGIANRVVEWGMSKIGSPVAIPEFPGLDSRYIITSNDAEALRRFLDESLSHYFANTQMVRIHAAGDIFTSCELISNFKTGDLVSMTQRVDRAMDIFRLFLK